MNYVGAIALLVGLVMRMFLPEVYAYVYICGVGILL